MTKPTIHHAKRTLGGWSYRNIAIKHGETIWTAIVDGETHGTRTMREMKALIDRLLDGPATL